MVAVEKRGKCSGRVRMSVIPDFKKVTIDRFLAQNVVPGSTIYTDGLKTFTALEEAGYKHVSRPQPHRTDLRKGAKSVVPLADRAIGNLQQWLTGTYHGVSRAQLQVYLEVSRSRSISSSGTPCCRMYRSALPKNSSPGSRGSISFASVRSIRTGAHQDRRSASLTHLCGRSDVVRMHMRHSDLPDVFERFPQGRQCLRKDLKRLV